VFTSSISEDDTWSMRVSKPGMKFNDGRRTCGFSQDGVNKVDGAECARNQWVDVLTTNVKLS